MNPLDFLNARRSTPSRLLGPPGPDEAQQRAIASAALRVPDHGKLAPWRILRIRGEQRLRLGEFLVRRQRERDPATPAAVLDKDRERFAFAPVVFTVIARPVPHKVPEIEQLLSAGSVCLVLLQAAQALGFGAQWLTGWMAYDDGVAAHLGLAADERIVGFVHVGSAREAAPERLRPAFEDRVSDWTG
ncbi:nitroreductase family protein [Chiayiivirga flava]|uniref:Putative NAD(P)H nitroreductase n=1 Tax=Chiayiivirga flava TaxID=659595 RepID=A0A7W8D3A1_9GAMM|nr:nitroreductase [Chiayiivirga flava]MBB5207146.1 nitroreductase [Chiayiivirga flava]